MSNEEGKISDRQIDKIRTIARSIELLLSIADTNLGRSRRLDNRRTPRIASARFSPSQDNVSGAI